MDEDPKRITQGRYVAEILQSRNITNGETFWYYVLHQVGLSDIIDLKKFSTFDKAMEGAKAVLANMNRGRSAAE